MTKRKRKSRKLRSKNVVELPTMLNVSTAADLVEQWIDGTDVRPAIAAAVITVAKVLVHRHPEYYKPAEAVGAVIPLVVETVIERRGHDGRIDAVSGDRLTEAFRGPWPGEWVGVDGYEGDVFLEPSM